MVIGAGVAPTPVGIPPVEALEIEKAVLPFIGADGPRWDIVRVPIPGSQNEVLVLLVDTPKQGQGPFVCLKSGDGLRDGAVYVRADGETREANSGELAQLMRRGTTTAASVVEFDVQVVGAVRPIQLDPDLTLEPYVQRERERLLWAPEQVKQPPKAEVLDGAPLAGAAAQIAAIAAQSNSALNAIQNALTTPETRSEEQYLAEIDDWDSEFRDAWPSAVLNLTAGLATPVELRIENRTKTFLHDVELKAHIAGDVHGLAAWATDEEIALDDLDLPSPPRAWGPKATSLAYPMLGMHTLPTFSGPVAPNFTRTRWTNSGSVDWTFSVGQLRGKEVDTSADDDLVLFTPDASLAEVTGTWSITARDHNDIFEGDLRVTIGEPLDLTAVFRHAMRLD